MKTISKVLLPFLFVLISFVCQGNPIIWAPVMISELHFDQNGNWTIELNIVQDPMIQGDSTLNNFRLVSKAGVAQFNPGIPIHLGDVIIIHQNNLQSPFSISQEDELLQLEQSDNNGGWIDFGIDLLIGNTFGGYCVPPVLNGQSVHLLSITIPPNQPTYWYAKSNMSNLGEVSYINSNCKGTLTGSVYDELHNPVPEGSVQVCYSPHMPDQWYGCMASGINGHFGFDLYACNTKIDVKDPSGNYLFKSIVVPIEPDSTVNIEIQLDTLLAGTVIICTQPIKYQILVSPNPMSTSANITVTIPDNKIQTAIIKIYDESGEIKGILPVNKSGNFSSDVFIPFSSIKYSLAQGIYFLSLEIAGKSVATNKMIIAQ